MEIHDYCKNVNTELTEWKSRLHDVVAKMDHLPTGDKQKIFEEINGLHIILTELEERIERLNTSCPTEWQPGEERGSNNLSGASSRFNDKSDIRFDYDYGG
ncbi:MAG: hypothetical protein ACWGOX_15995 [Desulforhopalus sp.]